MSDRCSWFWRRLSVAVFWLMAVGAGRAHAQQSLFNAPSGEITPAGHLFVREQVSLEHGYGDSNLTMDVGAMDGVLEVGVDVFHVTLYHGAQVAPGAPSVFGNVQLCLRLSRWARLLVGTQQGIVHSLRAPLGNHYGFQTYALAWLGAGEERPRGTWIIGVYAGNRSYLGAGSRGGVVVGYEIPLVGERLMLMGDAIIGTNTASVAVLGVQSMLDRHSRFQLAAGAQLPMPGTHNVYGCVLEFTMRPMGDDPPR